MDKKRTYIAIDLKSFYASVECVERGLNPLTTNLVVADRERSEKTICLAVSPSMKSYGLPGRLRLFEVVQKVKEINRERAKLAPRHHFKGSTFNNDELKANPSLALDFIAAPPRMALYIKYSTEIYNIYLKYIAPEDMHVYSIDEVFMEVTSYLSSYKCTAQELAKKIMQDIMNETGITATAGIGENLYLCKIALDIWAKHIKPDEDGVRIATLEEKTYREKLWNHRPLTDFWRIGRGYAKKLEEQHLYTMGDIARCSIGKDSEYYNEDLLYKLFGINAELLIDHAWGFESCTMKDIKDYKPESNSIGSGQVLPCPYDFDKARIVAMEMADMLSLNLVEKGLKTNQAVLSVGYDVENIKNENFRGEVKIDYYGRLVPKHSQGTINFDIFTSSTKSITREVSNLFDKIVNKNLFVKRLYLTATNVLKAEDAPRYKDYGQLNLFEPLESEEERKLEEKEENMQKALLILKNKYGKNSILKGISFEEGATAKERNMQIGGHRA